MNDIEIKRRMIKRIINMQNAINKMSYSNKKYTLFSLEIESMEKINNLHARLIPLYRSYSDMGKLV